MHRARATRIRARFIVGAVALVAASAAAGCSSSSTATRPSETIPYGQLASRPNIVFVLTDDLSENLVDYMPHVRALERRGATFSNYFVTDSLCCPSRTSILTGLLPHDSGVYTNTGSDGGFATFVRHGDTAKTFAVALQHAGYRTAMMGKYLNGYVTGFRAAGRAYVPRGWDEWDVGGNAYSEFNYKLNQNRRVVRYGGTARSYLTDVLSRLASSFIRRSSRGARPDGRNPFFLEVATYAPHAPYVFAPHDARRFADIQAPRTPAFDENDVVGNPRWLDRPPLDAAEIAQIDRDFRWRVRAVQAIDRMVEGLEKRIEDEGLAGNTYFVFSSDNGYHMGEHRLSPGKMTAFDTDIKVPLVVVGPGIRPGMKIDALAENIDLAPTFERLAGLTPPPTVDGRSLAPLFGLRPPGDWRRAVLVEHHGPDVDPQDPDFPDPGSGNPPSYEAMRLARAVYVEYQDGEREYYDIATDPYERRNVYASLDASQRASLHDQLAAIARCHGAASCSTADRLLPGSPSAPRGVPATSPARSA